MKISEYNTMAESISREFSRRENLFTGLAGVVSFAKSMTSAIEVAGLPRNVLGNLSFMQNEFATMGLAKSALNNKGLTRGLETLSLATGVLDTSGLTKGALAEISSMQNEFRVMGLAKDAFDTSGMARSLKELSLATGAWDTSGLAQSLGKNLGIMQSTLDTSTLTQSTFGNLGLIQNAFKSLEADKKFVNTGIASSLLAMQSTFSPVIDRLRKSERVFTSIQQAYEAFNISDVVINNDGSLSYDGEIILADDIESTITEQAKHLTTNKSLYEVKEAIQKKCWLILFIISLYLFLPEFIDKTVWYNENLIQPAINHIYSIEEKVYVSRDRAILRENANSRSDGIITVLYGDELKVIESVPRWVKVAYQDENGVIYIGFVSKISVEELTNE